MTPPTIYADFNNADSRGHLRLNTVGTIRDLAEKNVGLHAGLVLILYDEELQAEGQVLYSAEEQCWVAAIDWNQVHSRPIPSMQQSELRKT